MKEKFLTVHHSSYPTNTVIVNCKFTALLISYRYMFMQDVVELQAVVDITSPLRQTNAGERGLAC